jgi:hypothetical protein
MELYDGVWRDLDTGVDPSWFNPEEVDGALDDAGIPKDGPIHTRLEGPWGLPWYEGVEDPAAVTGLFASADPLPWSPFEDVGAKPIVGAYEGAFRTRGPVQAWGHEGDAIGRIMRFPANIPERYDGNGIWNIDYRDELAAVDAANQQPYISDAFINTNLILLPSIPGVPT